MRASLFIIAFVAGLSICLSTAGATGNPENGADVFRKCARCHQVGPQARQGVGPTLNGLFGRKAASLDFRYSKSMRRAGADGLVWTAETLDAYLENPRALVSGTRMIFPGLADAQARADLLAYLRQFSDSPSNIPEAEPTRQASDPDLDPAIMALEGDPAYGEYLAGECLGCHQADGADKGIPAITGWPRENFVIALHAYKKKIRPHEVMRMIAGRLSSEEIAALAAYFENAQ